jgi:hypothetical protein
MTAPITDPKNGRSGHASLGTDQLELKGRIDEILNRRPAVGLAVGVVRRRTPRVGHLEVVGILNGPGAGPHDGQAPLGHHDVAVAGRVQAVNDQVAQAIQASASSRVLGWG